MVKIYFWGWHERAFMLMSLMQEGEKGTKDWAKNALRDALAAGGPGGPVVFPLWRGATDILGTLTSLYPGAQLW
jgi:hypothetical protein